MTNEERERQKDLYDLIHYEITANLREVGYNKIAGKGWTTGQLNMILYYGNKNLWIRLDEGVVETQSPSCYSMRLTFELADPDVFNKITDFIVRG